MWNIFKMPKSHCLLLWSGIQKIFPKSQACHQYFQISPGGFDGGFTLRVTCSLSLFADKELWTNSFVWIENLFSSVCKWAIIILLIFSSRSFEWNLFMQSISKLQWRWVSEVICVFPHSPKFDIHITHTSNHWKNKHWLSQEKKVDGFFFPAALNDFLSISRDLIIRDRELSAGVGKSCAVPAGMGLCLDWGLLLPPGTLLWWRNPHLTNPENSHPRGREATAATKSCSRMSLYFKPTKNCSIC